MMETKTKHAYHLRMVAIKTAVITATAVVGMLITALLLNLFMLGSL